MPGKLPDRVEEVKPRNLEMTEIFDVVEPKKDKRVNSTVNILVDLESAKSSAMNLVESSDSDTDLIPTTNIDENYLKVQDVDIKQTNLEREMKKRREQISGEEEPIGSDSHPEMRRSTHKVDAKDSEKKE